MGAGTISQNAAGRTLWNPILWEARPFGTGPSRATRDNSSTAAGYSGLFHRLALSELSLR
jgi:hypothetical protein